MRVLRAASRSQRRGLHARCKRGRLRGIQRLFLGALAGKSRDGKPITDADFDKDGNVSFAEAHSYAVIQSDTIDVPVRTSEALLRQYSKLGDAHKKAKTSDAKGADDKSKDSELLELKGPLTTLAAGCHPDQRAVIELLAAKIGLKGSATVEDVQEKLKQAEDKLDAANSKSNTATRTRRNALKAVRNEIYANWPELQSEWAPLAVDLATDRADEFVSKVQKMPDYATLGYAKKREEELIKDFDAIGARQGARRAIVCALAKPPYWLPICRRSPSRRSFSATSSCSKWKRARSQIRAPRTASRPRSSRQLTSSLADGFPASALGAVRLRGVTFGEVAALGGAAPRLWLTRAEFAWHFFWPSIRAPLRRERSFSRTRAKSGHRPARIPADLSAARVGRARCQTRFGPANAMWRAKRLRTPS